MNIQTLSSIAQDLDDMAAQISTFKPVLNDIYDGTDNALSPSMYGQLEMIASLSDYINFRLSDAAAKLKKLNQPAS